MMHAPPACFPKSNVPRAFTVGRADSGCTINFPANLLQNHAHSGEKSSVNTEQAGGFKAFFNNMCAGLNVDVSCYRSSPIKTYLSDRVAQKNYVFCLWNESPSYSLPGSALITLPSSRLSGRVDRATDFIRKLPLSNLHNGGSLESRNGLFLFLPPRKSYTSIGKENSLLQGS